MPPPTTLEIEILIKRLFKLGYTHSQIVKEVKGQGYLANKNLVYNVLIIKGI